MDNLRENIDILWLEGRRQKLPLQLFLLLCLNLAIAPGVQAATGGEATRFQAYAIALLGLATIGLSTYLFFVMFQPERF
jgi:hypothetical protein